MCAFMFKMSHRPDGKMADALASTLACASANASVNSSGYVPQRPSKVPIAPMGFSHVLRVCLQGGGVYVESGTVSVLSCTITGNSATYVRAQRKTSHRPNGKIADMPKSTLIFRVGLIFGSIRDMYVPATPANFPSPRWETHILLVVAGRRCLRRGWHSDL